MVTETDTRQNTFKAIYTLLNASKPSTWYVRSSFPNVDTEFPLIIINPVQKTKERISADGTLNNSFLNITIQIVTHLDSAASVHDVGKDYIDSTLTGSSGISSLYSSGLVYLGLDDISLPQEQDINNNVYLVSTMMARFRL